MKIIDVSRDFSAFPSGRFPADGPFNGTRFREEILVPALRSGDVVRVKLDGVSGFGSSFLEEAFGGLVRVEGFSPSDLKARLEIEFQDSGLAFYHDSIREFIDIAIGD